VSEAYYSSLHQISTFILWNVMYIVACGLMISFPSLISECRFGRYTIIIIFTWTNILLLHVACTSRKLHRRASDGVDDKLRKVCARAKCLLILRKKKKSKAREWEKKKKKKKKHYLVNIPRDGSSGERVASKG